MSPKLYIKLLAVVLLSGCVVPITQHYGNGPLELSSNVASGFERYKRLAEPGFFAVATDGKAFGYSYCKTPPCSGDWDLPIRIAILGCEKKAVSPCKVYARGTKVVWN